MVADGADAFPPAFQSRYDLLGLFEVDEQGFVDKVVDATRGDPGAADVGQVDCHGPGFNNFVRQYLIFLNGKRLGIDAGSQPACKVAGSR